MPARTTSTASPTFTRADTAVTALDRSCHGHPIIAPPAVCETTGRSPEPPAWSGRPGSAALRPAVAVSDAVSAPRTRSRPSPAPSFLQVQGVDMDGLGHAVDMAQGQGPAVDPVVDADPDGAVHGEGARSPPAHGEDGPRVVVHLHPFREGRVLDLGAETIGRRPPDHPAAGTL